MPTIIATPNAPNANSFATHAEINTYFEERLPLNPPWVASGQEAVIIMAGRLLNSLAQPYKVLVPAQGGVAAYYRVRRQWTGTPATTTQSMAWGRNGMLDGNGNVIAPDVIPQALKDAQAELAGQLLKGDRTLDNDVIVQGLNSVRAGSVSLGFKDNIIPQVFPDAVYNLMPISWLTDELYQPALQAQFDVVSNGSDPWPQGDPWRIW